MYSTAKGTNTESLVNPQQLDIKHQRRIRWNHSARTMGAITESRRNNQRALPAHLHAFHALIPALDDLACAERKFKWVAAITRAVELAALVLRRSLDVQPAGVMHGYFMPCGGFCTLAQFDVGFNQFCHFAFLHG